MAAFHEFQLWTQTYAKLFAVISAAIILLSWLFENIWGKRLEFLKEDLDILLREKRASERHRGVQGKLLEVYQVTTGLRRRINDLESPSSSKADRRINNIAESLEWPEVEFVSMAGTLDLANTVRDHLPAVDPPEKLTKKVQDHYNELTGLMTRFQQARDEMKGNMDTITGQEDRFPYGKLNDEAAGQLAVMANEFIGRVGEFAVEYVIISNSMNEIHFEVVDFVRRKVAVTESFRKKVWHIQLTLFLIGTILAIYGTYLDAIKS